MRKTAVGAPAPKPSIEEMLDALDRMTAMELSSFRDKITEKWVKKWIDEWRKNERR